MLCPYCARPIEGRAETEHVFPASWYPDGTDSSIQRLVVPSCAGCNREYGKIEARLLRVFALGLPDDNPAARGIGERAVRALNPDDAHNAVDAYHRAKARRSIISSAKFVPLDSPGHFPGVRLDLRADWGPSSSGVWVKGARALSFRAGDLEAFAAKLVRGLFYLGSAGTPIPKEAVIQTYFAPPEVWPKCARMTQDLQMVLGGVPPGFLFWATAVSRTNYTSLWFFKIWDTFLFQAAAFRPGEEPEPDSP